MYLFENSFKKDTEAVLSLNPMEEGDKIRMARCFFYESPKMWI